jgi:hypothetical protein
MVVMHLEGTTDVPCIMEDVPRAGGASFGAVTGVDKFYYLPHGAKTWQYLGAAHTDDSGNAAIDVLGTLDGQFRIVFPAQGDFLGSSGTASLG